MSERILSVDRMAGTVEYFSTDPHTGVCTIRTEQLHDPILERNKDLASSARTGWKGEMHLVGSLPMTMVVKLMEIQRKDGSHAFQGALRKWLNDADNSAFRVKRGKV